MGNGMKAQTTRNRKGKQETAKKPTSQLKSNQEAQNKICAWCMKPLQSTAKVSEMDQHYMKDEKTWELCWPTWDRVAMLEAESQADLKKKKKTPAAK